ncbi:porin [Paraburkholderia sp. BL10I2N1]|uniref:porin n=1 Tax=Paraburkholderia sp. BL10I2N1 TaxID=1938796 RepID=UPI00105D49C8|nr:porin [Paraburkholderia sp. BL10I2N1]TDN57960.1 putative porin [Paraburkholderia sp. BL10I2N1]
MKKEVFALSMMAAATMAHAQSSVTLYGRIDNGIQYETGLPGGHAWSAQSGDWGCSWFGLQGSEDLGGGTKSVFQLEGQLNTMTGASAGNLFGRHATIGVTNDKFGLFKIGNLGAGELAQDSWGTDPQLMQRYAISTLVRGRNWTSTSNGAEYNSPVLFGGLVLKGQYSLTNNTHWNSAPVNSAGVPTGQGRTNAVEGIYTWGGGDFRVIYDEVRGADGSFNNVYSASRMVLAGGTYNIGPVRLYAGYQHMSAPSATNASMGVTDASQPAGVSAPTTVDHEWFGAEWQATNATAVTGAVYHANANHGNGNATLFTLAATYALSKRTFVYMEAGYVHNSSTSNINLGNGSYGNNNFNPVTGTSSNSNPNYGQSQTGVFAGIMTMF